MRECVLAPVPAPEEHPVAGGGVAMGGAETDYARQVDAGLAPDGTPDEKRKLIEALAAQGIFRSCRLPKTGGEKSVRFFLEFGSSTLIRPRVFPLHYQRSRLQPPPTRSSVLD